MPFQFVNANLPPSQLPKLNFLFIRTAIRLHLLCNPICTQHYENSMFYVRHFIFSLLKPPSLKYPTLKTAHMSAVFWFASYSFTTTPINFSSNHSLVPINTRPFLCSLFWWFFLTSVREKSLKKMNTRLKAILKFCTIPPNSSSHYYALKHNESPVGGDVSPKFSSLLFIN